VPRLSKEERAELEKRLKDDDEQADAYEVEIGQGENYARLPYGKAKAWLQKSFGIDLDDLPKPDDGKDDKGKGDGNVRPFGGRRTG